MSGKRTQVAIRLTDEGLKRVDQFAAEEERSRSDMIRKLLSEAIQRRDADAKGKP
jgi:metal-responsive CopG/Arc/MetJ family transcriptional regulator